MENKTENFNKERQIQTKDDLEAIFNNVLDGITVQDASGYLLFANDAAVKFLGYNSLQEILETPATEITSQFEMYGEDGLHMQPSDLPGRKALQGVACTQTLIRWRNTVTGNEGWSEVKASPVFNADNSVKYAINIWRDVTAQKSIQKEYERIHRRNQHILESITDGFFALDNGWHFTYINKQAEKLFLARPREELLGKNILEEFPYSKQTETFRQLGEALARKEPLRYEEYFAQAGRWIESSVYPSKDGLSVYLRDITEQKLSDDINAKLAAIVESSEDAIIGKTLDGIITSWNRGAEMIYGYSEVEVIGKNVSILAPAQFQNDVVLLLEEAKKGVALDHFETVRKRKDGEHINVSISISPVKNKEGQIIGLSTVARDISKQKSAEEALRRSEERFRSLIENSTDGVVMLDKDATITYASQTINKILGYTIEEFVGRNAFELMHADDIPNVMAIFSDLLTKLPGQMLSAQYRYLHKNGNWVWLEAHGNNLLSDEIVSGIVVNYRDITDRKLSEQLLKHQLYHDHLTDLPNRTYLREQFAQALATSAAEKKNVALMLLDLDRFKHINDSLGHSVGDRLIQEVALRFRSSLKDQHILSRLGGDEFGIVIPNVQTEGEIAELSTKILENFRAPFYLDSYELYISPSIGISLYPYDGVEPATLFKNAEAALYRAKDHGRNTYQFYTTTMNSASYERLTLESKLRHAIENDEFVMYFQPQVDISSGKVVGAEALIRWQRPHSSLVPPDRFIPLAEANGLIEPIGTWVLGESLKQAKIWHNQGFKMIVAINLSARQFKQKNFESIVSNIIEKSGVDPAFIELELTETVLAENPETVMRIMSALRERGVRFCLDDFSTGYSSLRYIKQFPVDMLKIERSFLKDIPTDLQNCAIAKSIITLGRSLNLEVTAEGVESKKQLAFLRENLCHRAQGYLFNGAMPSHALSEILSEDRYVSVVNSLDKPNKLGLFENMV